MSFHTFRASSANNNEKTAIQENDDLTQNVHPDLFELGAAQDDLQLSHSRRPLVRHRPPFR